MIASLYRDATDRFKNLELRDPVVFMTCVTAVIVPFVAKYYFLLGMIIGLGLAISMLILVKKSPKFVKRIVLKYPLFADLSMSAFAIGTIGVYFGDGLTLGIAAVATALILSVCLKQYEKNPSLLLGK